MKKLTLQKLLKLMEAKKQLASMAHQAMLQEQRAIKAHAAQLEKNAKPVRASNIGGVSAPSLRHEEKYLTLTLAKADQLHKAADALEGDVSARRAILESALQKEGVTSHMLEKLSARERANRNETEENQRALNVSLNAYAKQRP